MILCFYDQILNDTINIGIKFILSFEKYKIPEINANSISDKS